LTCNLTWHVIETFYGHVWVRPSSSYNHNFVTVTSHRLHLTSVFQTSSIQTWLITHHTQRRIFVAHRHLSDLW